MTTRYAKPWETRGEFWGIDNTYWIVIIAVIVIIFIFWMINMDYNNHYVEREYRPDTFGTIVGYGKELVCNNCGDRNRESCGECQNCGYCYTPDGYGECVAGDANGPFYRDDCVDYEYRTPVLVDDYYYLYPPARYPNLYYYDTATRRYIIRDERERERERLRRFDRERERRYENGRERFFGNREFNGNRNFDRSRSYSRTGSFEGRGGSFSGRSGSFEGRSGSFSGRSGSFSGRSGAGAGVGGSRGGSGGRR